MSKSSSSAAGIIDVLDEPGRDPQEDRPGGHQPGSEVRADERRSRASPTCCASTRRWRRRPPGAGDQVRRRRLRRFLEVLAEVMAGALAPIRERTEKMLADEGELDRMLAPGPAGRGRRAGDRRHGQGPGGLPPRPGAWSRTATPPATRAATTQGADPGGERDGGDAVRLSQPDGPLVTCAGRQGCDLLPSGVAAPGWPDPGLAAWLAAAGRAAAGPCGPPAGSGRTRVPTGLTFPSMAKPQFSSWAAHGHLGEQGGNA